MDLLCLFSLAFAMPLYASVYMCLVVICWERADLLSLVCGVLYILKRVSFRSKDCTKELKLECAYFLGQTS